jgi:type IV pilus assembly protein PilW
MNYSNVIKHSNTIKKQQQGLSLVELLVAMLIGLVVSLAVYSVLNVNEGRKRTTTSINDIDKVGIYTLHQLDQSIRSAGSGLLSSIKSSIAKTGAVDYTLGCQINAVQSGATLLPASTKLPAPFDQLPAPLDAAPLNFRIAPVIILDGAANPGNGNIGGDIIITMSGSGGLGETATKFFDLPQNNSLSLPNVAGFFNNALVLITRPPNATVSPCIIAQVNNSFIPIAGAKTLPLGGAFYQNTVNGIALTSFDTDAHVLNLGLAPNFQLFGVGANSTLFRYDLLSPASSTGNTPNPAPFADSVYQMHALYGVYTTPGAPASFTWVAPTGDYDASNLLAGTAAANATLASIKAIKLGIVMQASLPERVIVSRSTIRLFGDTNIPLDVTLPPAQLNQRYKALEAVIPLRNGLML